jgi:hypothetical protein
MIVYKGLVGSARFQRAAFGIFAERFRRKCLPQDASNCRQDAGAPSF